MAQVLLRYPVLLTCLSLILAAVPARGSGFLINEEVLLRHGFTLERYQEMSRSERSTLEDWIRSRDAGASALPARDYLFDPEGTGEDLSARAGVLFDNAAGDRLPLSDSWDATVAFAGIDLRSLNLSDDEAGIGLEGGYLDPSGISSLLGPSPYLSITKRTQGSGRRIDYDILYGAAFVDLEARYDPNDPGFDSSSMFVGSILGRAGRAYNLFGPFDVGWSAMGLLRLTDLFPNLTLDQTVGTRVRLGDGLSLGLFTGLTESAARLSRDWGGRELGGDNTAPHRGIAIWGKTPGSGVDYSLELRSQDNPLTRVERASGSVSFPTKKGRISIFAEKDVESGEGIEFDRRKEVLGAEWTPSPTFSVSLRFYQDEIQFGSARSESSGWMLQFRITERRGSGRTLTLKSLLGAEQRLLLPEADTLEIVESLNDGVRRLEAILEETILLLDTIDGPEAAAALLAAYEGLDPEIKAILESEFGQFDPSRLTPETVEAILDSAVGGLSASAEGLRRLADFLSGQENIDAIAINYVRAVIYEKLPELQISIFGRDIPLTPTKLIALAHAYGAGIDPLLPLTRSDIDALMSASCGGQPPTVCLLRDLSEADRAALEEILGEDAEGALSQTVAWAADTVGREVNAFLLSVFLAAERLDALTVDRGERLGYLNQKALQRSFSLLDERRAKAYGSIYPRIMSRVSASLEVQNRQLKSRAMGHGAQGLERLIRGPGWPKNVEAAVRSEDWPDLLSNFGETALFEFIQRSAGKLSSSSPGGTVRFLIVFDKDSVLGPMISRGEFVVVTLVPLDPGQAPGSLLDFLYELL